MTPYLTSADVLINYVSDQYSCLGLAPLLHLRDVSGFEAAIVFWEAEQDGRERKQSVETGFTQPEGRRV